MRKTPAGRRGKRQGGKRKDGENVHRQIRQWKKETSLPPRGAMRRAGAKNGRGEAGTGGIREDVGREGDKVAVVVKEGLMAPDVAVAMKVDGVRVVVPVMEVKVLVMELLMLGVLGVGMGPRTPRRLGSAVEGAEDEGHEAGPDKGEDEDEDGGFSSSSDCETKPSSLGGRRDSPTSSS